MENKGKKNIKNKPGKADSSRRLAAWSRLPS
jgi:hypothetical protein